MTINSKRLKPEDWITQLANALVEIEGLDVDERLRKTLIRACSEAMVEAEDRLHNLYEHRNSSKKWTSDDIELLKSNLEAAPICKSWAEENMILDELVDRKSVV
jgi:hypothetical protein